jgi:hypothetical protein
MFRPGERVADWDEGGADPDAALNAAGADRNYFLIHSSEGPSVIILTGRRIADFAPGGWRVVDSYGSPVDAVERPFVQFTSISARHVFATRANSIRRGGADCTHGVVHAILYEVPGGTENEEENVDAVMMFRLGLLAMEGQTLCTRYDPDPVGGWRMRPFLPDGARLPALERPDDHILIVPAAPLDRLLVRPEPAAASAPAAT